MTSASSLRHVNTQFSTGGPRPEPTCEMTSQNPASPQEQDHLSRHQLSYVMEHVHLTGFGPAMLNRGRRRRRIAPPSVPQWRLAGRRPDPAARVALNVPTLCVRCHPLSRFRHAMIGIVGSVFSPSISKTVCIIDQASIAKTRLDFRSESPHVEDGHAVAPHMLMLTTLCSEVPVWSSTHQLG